VFGRSYAERLLRIPPFCPFFCGWLPRQWALLIRWQLFPQLAKLEQEIMAILFIPFLLFVVSLRSKVEWFSGGDSGRRSRILSGLSVGEFRWCFIAHLMAV